MLAELIQVSNESATNFDCVLIPDAKRGVFLVRRVCLFVCGIIRMP